MESPQTESNIIQPGKPELISTGYCHAVLRWSISDLKTNNIQYFELQYREFKGRKRGNWESVQTGSNQNEYKLQVLKPSTEYEFRVGAVFCQFHKESFECQDGSIQFTVIDLKGGTDYEFKVAAIVNGETVAFSEASQKICTKLSLARTIQLDAKQLIDRGPPQRFKLPVL
ncbi:unnamed protein product [Mytilus edulis]|uniref:Fibronectin type-III domain-containing protein n=1 Tax=Mytilus edulis TaxID=6550 RepID=A0A8S3QDV5_MYTED|nr:unnamed protein product [Mytilus edulis]